MDQQLLNFSSIKSTLVQSSDPSRNRSRGSEYSKAAHEKVVHSKEETYKRILKYVEAAGNATSKEIAAELNKPLHTVSGRFAELKQLGRLRGTGESRENAEVLVLV